MTHPCLVFNHCFLLYHHTRTRSFLNFRQLVVCHPTVLHDCWTNGCVLAWKKTLWTNPLPGSKTWRAVKDLELLDQHFVDQVFSVWWYKQLREHKVHCVSSQIMLFRPWGKVLFSHFCSVLHSRSVLWANTSHYRASSRGRIPFSRQRQSPQLFLETLISTHAVHSKHTCHSPHDDSK